MNRTEKQVLVDGLTSKIKDASVLYYTDFTGLNVKGMTELRRRLRKAGVEYVVIKNTLATRAITDSGRTSDRLRGPTGVVIGQDAITAAKVLTDFAKEFEQRPTVKGGVVDGRSITSAQVKRLASMPSLAAFAGALQGLLSTFVGALDALRAQREAPHQG
jgi:large subunit ribosomal protein L10